MPKITRSNTHLETPKQRKPQRKPHGPFGPYTQTDNALKGMTRSQATAFNEKRISAVLHDLVQNVQTSSAHSRRHKMTRQLLSYGKTNLLDAGRWYQKVGHSIMPLPGSTTNNALLISVWNRHQLSVTVSNGHLIHLTQIYSWKVMF